LDGTIDSLFDALVRVSNTTLYQLNPDHSKDTYQYKKISGISQIREYRFTNEYVEGRALTNTGEFKVYPFGAVVDSRSAEAKCRVSESKSEPVDIPLPPAGIRDKVNVVPPQQPPAPPIPIPAVNPPPIIPIPTISISAATPPPINKLNTQHQTIVRMQRNRKNENVGRCQTRAQKNEKKKRTADENEGRTTENIKRRKRIKTPQPTPYRKPFADLMSSMNSSSTATVTPNSWTMTIDIASSHVKAAIITAVETARSVDKAVKLTPSRAGRYDLIR
jgi:hypothetical protein